MRKIFYTLFLIVTLSSCIKGQNVESLNKTTSNSFVIGNIDTIYSYVLSENRIINIYLPDGYCTDSTKTYPVIYLLDGSANEYFIHVVGLINFFTLPWINRMPKSIVVGISNVNRNRDLTFYTSSKVDFYATAGLKKKYFPVTGGSEKFILFLEKELQPYIEKKYKTSSSKAIIGQSLGGLLATEILLKKPYLFDTYLIMSPSLWWDSESLLLDAPYLLKRNLRNKIKAYVGVSSEGKNMEKDVKQLVKILKTDGADNVDVIYDYISDENHSTMVHQSIYNAIKLLYPKN
jgi:uncharacterized protein